MIQYGQFFVQIFVNLKKKNTHTNSINAKYGFQTWSSEHVRDIIK